MKKNILIPLFSAFLLTFCGGFCDSYSYIYRGKLFATMQTGNLIKFFISLAEGNFDITLLLPICFFVLGCLIAALINKHKDYSNIMLILLFATYLAAGFLPYDTVWNCVCVCALSFASGIQFQAFRKCLTLGYTSTMCTNNLRLFSESIAQANWKNMVFYISIIFFFIVGCVVAIFLGKGLEYYSISPISSIFIVVIVLNLIFKNSQEPLTGNA